MYHDVVHSGCPWSNELVRELTDEEFRHEYMMDQVRTYIAFQIRALREQPNRRWSQGDLAKKSEKTQSVISRLEDPDYGKHSLQTLLEIAIAYDLPLLVQFADWDDWLTRMSNVSPSGLRRRSFDAERLYGINKQQNAASGSSASASSESIGSLQVRSLGGNSPSAAGAASGDLNHSVELQYMDWKRTKSNASAEGALA